jgi:hypothetical protein
LHDAKNTTVTEQSVNFRVEVVMSLVIVETVAEQPMTDADLEKADQIGLPCLQAHGATWHYSLLSVDRCQMICIFDAPDAASVRDSYAKLGVQKRAIWAGELIQPEGTQAQPDLTERYVIEVHYPALSETDWNELRHQFSQCCTAFGVNWWRSYLSLDRTRVVYELDAPVAELSHKFSIPSEGTNRVWSAHLLTPYPATPSRDKSNT